MHVSTAGSHGDEAARHAGWRGHVRGYIEEEIAASGLPVPLQEAIRYGSTAPEASRWRALLVLEVGRALGASPGALLPAAAAVEVLHCATLSIDDLPSMDDAVERRGLPAMHRRFNEAMAIQASLWLLGASRTLMARAAAAAGVSAEAAARLAALQQRVENDLQLGQFMDMMGILGKADMDEERVARLKCGRLFALAAQVPALLLPASGTGGRTPADCAAVLDAFGEEVGLAYQIRDDLEDIGEDEAAATWSAGETRGRPTIVSKQGLAEATHRIARCTEDAIARLAVLEDSGIDCDPIERMTLAMLGRM